MTTATEQFNDNRQPLVIREISVLRAPGISPGFILSDLSPDITIVFGPNASGKSTTARAIQAILWPHQSALRGHHLAASLSLGDDTWQIEASAGRVERNRDGQPIEPPVIAPLDDRGRYSLGLPELLASENQPLAQAILNESSGGFDLPQVAESLGFSNSIPPRLQAANAVRSAADSLNQAAASQQNHLAALSERSQLQSRRERAIEAERDLDAIEIAREYRRQLADQANITAEIDQFPNEVRSATGDEESRISDLTERINAQQSKIAEANRIRDRWQATIDQAGLADIGNPADDLATLEKLEQQQSELRELLAVADRDVAAAVTERATHQKRLAADLDDEQIASVDAAGMRDFADIAATFESIRSRRTAQDEVELWLGGVTPPENLDALRQGVETLQTRLQYPNAAEQREISGKARWIGIGAGLFVAVDGIILALMGNPLWWILAAVGVILMALAWKFTSSNSPKIAAELETTYAALPLPQPEMWRAHHVRDLLGELRDELKVALVEQEKADRWQDLEQERKELEEAYAATEQRREAAVAKYGVAPDLKEESLRLLADNLGRWQAADATLRGIEGRRNRMKADASTLENRASEVLTKLGYNSGEISNHLADLQRRIDSHHQATSERDTAQVQIDDQLQPTLDSLIAERDHIFTKLGLEADDSAGLRTLQQQHSALLAAQDRLANRKAEVRNVWDSLALSPQFREMDIDELNTASNAARQIANERAEIEEQLRELDRLERTATRSDVLENAQRELESAKIALRDDRDRVMQNVAGHLLLSSIQQETRDAALPIVFHRARELFAIITRGKYELQFEVGPPPEFTALDTGNGMTLSLDQLSSGTRVQLLMAIRLAFVENVEVGPKLPVILDETLGNSDEFRASAIIDAAIDICKHGRQVFYFTAQGDEVARWLQRVDSMPEEERPQVKVVELAEVRRDAGFDRLPIAPPSEVAAPALPSPTDYDPETWAAALRVPAVDPWAESIGSMHLWHAVTDSQSLYALLQSDITTFGQLDSLDRTNSAQLSQLDPNLPDLMPEIRLRAGLISDAISMWRIGRARPMPEGVLADAEMIDAAAMSEMQALQIESNNDGATLLERIQTMDDPPLAEKPMEAFELWLISEGYVAQGRQMSESDIRARIIELGSPGIRQGFISTGDIDSIVEQMRLW